jgi:hypothetical protein
MQELYNKMCKDKEEGVSPKPSDINIASPPRKGASARRSAGNGDVPRRKKPPTVPRDEASLDRRNNVDEVKLKIPKEEDDNKVAFDIQSLSTFTDILVEPLRSK